MEIKSLPRTEIRAQRKNWHAGEGHAAWGKAIKDQPTSKKLKSQRLEKKSQEG